MRISDWTSDVCSSDLWNGFRRFMHWRKSQPALRWGDIAFVDTVEPVLAFTRHLDGQTVLVAFNLSDAAIDIPLPTTPGQLHPLDGHGLLQGHVEGRSEEHTSELQSLMRISYAVFCLK